MLKVSIVDENPLVLKQIGEILKNKGYDVVYEARDGTEALNKNLETPAQVVIFLHPAMAIANPGELANRFSSKHPETRIIFLDGSVLLNDYVPENAFVSHTTSSPEELLSILEWVECKMNLNEPLTLKEPIEQKINFDEPLTSNDPIDYKLRYERLVHLLRLHYGDRIASDFIKIADTNIKLPDEK